MSSCEFLHSQVLQVAGSCETKTHSCSNLRSCEKKNHSSSTVGKHPLPVGSPRETANFHDGVQLTMVRRVRLHICTTSVSTYGGSSQRTAVPPASHTRRGGAHTDRSPPRPRLGTGGVLFSRAPRCFRYCRRNKRQTFLYGGSGLLSRAHSLGASSYCVLFLPI